MDKKKALTWIAGGCGAMLWLGFIWPTPYEYTRQAPNVWRVSRFTGVREVSTGKGWRVDSPSGSPAILGPEEVSMLGPFGIEEWRSEQDVQVDFKFKFYGDGDLKASRVRIYPADAFTSAVGSEPRTLHLRLIDEDGFEFKDQFIFCSGLTQKPGYNDYMKVGLEAAGKAVEPDLENSPRLDEPYLESQERLGSLRKSDLSKAKLIKVTLN